MTETIFWDTAAFVALGNARDDLHHAAVAVSQELAQAQAHVLTTDAVLIEVVNTFSRVNWRPTAGRLIEMMKASVQLGTASIVHVDVESSLDSDQNVGLADPFINIDGGS